LSDSKKILIAKIQAHQGLKGWLKIYSYSETSEKFSKYSYFFISNEENNYIQLKVEKIIFDKNIKIKFENYNSREELEKYIGKYLYIENDQLDELEENQFYWEELIGLEVYLENDNKIGVVSDIIETGSNDVLVIQGNKEYLIPYLYGESIKKISLKDKKIIINNIYYE
jgi:16S rRNA processing protein RimM